MNEKQMVAPDNTAVRVALWRALHLEADSLPHVFEDPVGLKLVSPDPDWRSRPDMSPFTRAFRASIVGRARFVEDLVAEQAAQGVTQYVILGAGLDTFAQRRPALRHGSASASSISAWASHRSCGSCQSTLRRARRGGNRWLLRVLTPENRRTQRLCAR